MRRNGSQLLLVRVRGRVTVSLEESLEVYLVLMET